MDATYSCKFQLNRATNGVTNYFHEHTDTYITNIFPAKPTVWYKALELIFRWFAPHFMAHRNIVLLLVWQKLPVR